MENTEEYLLQKLQESEEEDLGIWIVQEGTIDIFLITEVLRQLPEKARRDYLRKQMEYQRMIR